MEDVYLGIRKDVPKLHEKCHNCGTLTTSVNIDAYGQMHKGQVYAKFHCPNCDERWGHLIKQDERNVIGFDQKAEEHRRNRMAGTLRHYSPTASSAVRRFYETRARQNKQLARFHDMTKKS